LIGGKMAEQLRDENPLDFEVVLPTDVVGRRSLRGGRRVKVCPTTRCGRVARPRYRPETRARFANEITQAKTIFWNGPMGVFEWPRFAAGTKAVAEAVARADAFSVVAAPIRFGR